MGLQIRAGQVVWYLMTEFMQLRRAAAAKLGGDKLLTKLDALLSHVIYGSNETDAVVEVLRTPAGELSLSSFADFHVHTRSSGYCRVGARWSGKWHSGFSVDAGLGISSRGWRFSPQLMPGR